VAVSTANRAPLATPKEVAEYYGVPEKTLAQWRSRGIGPRFSKIGRHVRYRWADVEKHVDVRTVESR
jgi:excisionase family DNA binding protein